MSPADYTGMGLGFGGRLAPNGIEGRSVGTADSTGAPPHRFGARTGLPAFARLPAGPAREGCGPTSSLGPLFTDTQKNEKAGCLLRQPRPCWDCHLQRGNHTPGPFLPRRPVTSISIR